MQADCLEVCALNRVLQDQILLQVFLSTFFSSGQTDHSSSESTDHVNYSDFNNSNCSVRKEGEVVRAAKRT